MRSSKWHALGNTYVVVERAGAGPLDPERVRELSRDDDGVLEVVAAGDDSVEIVVWNADGSQAELSGNGTRIAAAWLAERTGARTIRVRVGAREVVARILDGGQIEQELGAVEVGAPERVDGVDFVPVTVGNPHAVVQGDPAEVGRLGPLLETHRRFPDRTNVQVARVVRPGEVTARVWERGVGETASSGTGAVAVAAATHRDGDVLVHFPGGDLRVRLQSGRAFLTGPAERVADSKP
jgi:diaminopimelate epimerase